MHYRVTVREGAKVYALLDARRTAFRAQCKDHTAVFAARTAAFGNISE
jgi:hypothetical protein